MDKRLGKIRVAMSWVYSLPSALRNLIVAPIPACAGWLDEAEKEGEPIFFLHGKNRDPATFYNWEATLSPEKRAFALINPEGLFTPKARSSHGEPAPTDFALFPWHSVLWDESVNIKNTKAQLTKVAHACFGDCPHRAILSGEIAPEGLLDTFEQLRWCFGTFMGHRNFWKWRQENFDPVGFRWLPKSKRREAIRHALHERCFVLTRRDAGIKGVPPFHDRRLIELPAAVRKAYDRAEKFFELPKDLAVSDVPEAKETKFAVVVDNWKAQLCGGYPKDFSRLHSPHKLKVLLELLDGELQNEPVVVTFRFNSELDAVAAALSGKSCKFKVLRGSVLPEERRKIQHGFGRDFRILLAQSRVLTFGIDLSVSSTMVLYSVPPSYNVFGQMIDRLVLPTKADRLSYIWLCVENSIDEDLYEALGNKKVEARFLMNSLEQFRKARLERNK